MSGLTHQTITDLAPQLERREVSPVELTQAALDTIAALEPQLNAFITVKPEEALASARQAEAEIRAGQHRGPLHGIPVGIKDNIAVAGWPTTNGSKALANYVTEYDATVVSRLRAAGAILVGKNNMHEWAMGGTCAMGYFGPVHNPWATDCIPGGSSGGSAAAVSSGEILASLGTDGMGSIRQPAAQCGIVGLKPTQGLVGRWGELPATSSSTDHIGPLCKTVADAALVLRAIAGHDPKDPTSVRSETKDYPGLLAGGVRGLRVGVPENYFFDDLDPEVERAVRQAADTLATLGAELRPITVPLVDYAYVAFSMIPTEALAFHRPIVAHQPDAYQDKEIRYRLIAQDLMLARDMQLAMRVRNRIRAEFRRLMDEVDVLIAPAVPVPAYPSGAREIRYGDRVLDLTQPLSEHRLTTRLTFPFNMTGNPVISLPCGFTAAGKPIGLQIAGKHWQDDVVLQTAYTFQQAAGIGYRVPPVAQILSSR